MDLIGILSDSETDQLYILLAQKANLYGFVNKIVLPRLPISENRLKLDFHYDVIRDNRYIKYEKKDFYPNNQVSLYTLMISLRTCTGSEVHVNTGNEMLILKGSAIRGSAIFLEAKHALELRPVSYGRRLLLVFHVYCLDNSVINSGKYMCVNTEDCVSYTLPSSWLAHFPKNNLRECDVAHIKANDFKPIYEYFLRKLSKSEEITVLKIAKNLGLVAQKSHYFLPLDEVKTWNLFISKEVLFFLSEKVDFFNTINAEKLNIIKFVAFKKVSGTEISWTVYLNNGSLWIDDNKPITSHSTIKESDIMCQYIEMILRYRKLNLTMKVIKQPKYTIDEVNYQLHVLNYYYSDIIDALTHHKPYQPDFTFTCTTLSGLNSVKSFNLVYGFVNIPGHSGH
jgi:hypothetical protein